MDWETEWEQWHHHLFTCFHHPRLRELVMVLPYHQAAAPFHQAVPLMLITPCAGDYRLISLSASRPAWLRRSTTQSFVLQRSPNLAACNPQVQTYKLSVL